MLGGTTGISQVLHPHHPPGSHQGSHTWKSHVDVIVPLAFVVVQLHCLQGQSQGILFARENLDTLIQLQ